MKHHVKTYFDYFGIYPGETILCEVCGSLANDIHHIESRGMGGSTEKDIIGNLMAVCRECHIKYGDKKQYIEFLQEKHNQKLKP
jgi:ribosome-binding protein aMBF1 (putative translation factor)